MNKVFNVVWDNAAQNWVAVSELAKANNVLATSLMINEVEEYSQKSYKTNSYQLSAIATTLMLAGVALFTAPSAYAAGDGALTDAQLKQILKVNTPTSATASEAGAIALGNGAKANAPRTVAIGQNTKALADDQVALGTNANAGNSTEAVAIGANSNANGGKAAVAIGPNSTASSRNSVAIGNGTQAIGTESITIGVKSMATQDSAIAIGSGSKAKQDGVVSIGYNATAEGLKSVSIGENTTVSGRRSTAIGDNTNITGNDSYVLGHDVTATTSNSVILGAHSNGSATANKVVNATVAGVTYGNFTGAPQTTGHYVSVGSKDNERQVKFVAAGEITSNSTDAINGSQLYAVLNNLPSSKEGKISPTPEGKAIADATNGTLATVTDVANTVNNVHWSVEGKDSNGNAANFTVKAGDKVKFANTSTTSVTVNPADKSIGFDVKTTGITTNPNGTTTVAPDGNGTNLVNGTTVTDAINNSYWTASGVDKDGNSHNVSVKPGSTLTFANGTTTQTILTKDGNISVEVKTTDLTNNNGSTAIANNGNGSSLVNGTTVTNAINNSYWTANGKDSAGNAVKVQVNPGDQVSFNDGNGTTARLTADGNVSFDINTTNLTNNNGTVAIAPNGNGSSLVNGDTVTNAINNSYWTARGTDAAGKAIDVKVNPGDVVKFANGTGTTAVLSENGTVSINLATGNITVDDKGKVTPPTDDNKGNLVNTTTVTNVINNTSWTANVKNDNNLTTAEKDGSAKIKAGDTLNITAGQNLQAAFDDNKNLTLTTRPNVTFTNVNVGGKDGVDLTTNNGSLRLGSNATGDPVQITNVAPGLNNPDGTPAIKSYSELANVTGDILRNVVTVADLKTLIPPVDNNKNQSGNVTEGGPFFVSVSKGAGEIGDSGLTQDVTKIEPNQTLDVEADKNIMVTLKNQGIKIATKDDVDFKSVTTNKLGLKGADGKNGEPGKSADITFDDGKGTIKPGEESGIERIKYTTNVTYPNGTTTPVTRELATMDDGLIFKGDTGSAIRSPLGSTVNIVGGAKGSLTNGNIGVDSDGTGTLAVKLAKDIDLGPDGSITIGGTTINNGSITGLKGTLPVTDNTTVKSPALPSDATTTSSKAATVGDILNAGWNIQENGEAKDFVKHGDNVNFKNGTGTRIVIDKDATTGTTSVSVHSPMAYVNTDSGDTSTPSNTVQMVGKDGAPVAIRNVSSGLVDNKTGKPVTLSQAKGDTLTNAANIGDLKAVTQGIRNDIDNINNDIHDLDKRVRGVGASAAAASSLPQVMTAGKSMVSASAGGYSGASAVAVGYSRASDNGKLLLKLTGTANSQGHYSGGIGMGYQF